MRRPRRRAADDLALRPFYGRALAVFGRALGGALWNIAKSTTRACSSMGCARATYRSLLSRQHLLRWTTAAAAENSRRHLFPKHRARALTGTTTLALLLLAALMLAGTPNPFLSVALCLRLGRRASVDLVDEPAAAGSVL